MDTAEQEGQTVAKSGCITRGYNGNTSDTEESAGTGDLKEEVSRLRRLLGEKDEEIARLKIATKNINDHKSRYCDFRLQDRPDYPDLSRVSSRLVLDDNLDNLRTKESKSKSSNEEESKTRGTPNRSDLDDTVAVRNIDRTLIYSGDGPSPSDGSVVKIHYTISLDEKKPKIIENSRERNSGGPFEFVLGSEGSVIKGWNIALKKMKRGEISMIKIPSEYGYGVHGLPPIIPKNNALLCRIELIDFWKYAVPFRPWVVDLQSVEM